MENKHFIAFDLGATSGRTILGTLTPDGKLTTQEVTRFPNQMLDIDGHLYWNIYSLYEHLVEGLKAVVKMGIKPSSAGIDTWGVDVALVAPGGKLMGVPYAYRDRDTIGSAERFFNNVMPADDLYAKTGIQHLDFNTVFQLNQHRDEWERQNAETILFIPDALNYMLTGVKATEYTIASTGAIIDPATRRIDESIIEAAGSRPDQWAKVVEPGTVLGRLLDNVARAAGIEPIPVVAVAGHDTASAIAAIPARTRNFAYLSSGTWSLMGVETEGPVINDITARVNITNEGGVFGTIRLLKNITGMWIVEQCLKKWKSEGTEYSYPRMVELAEAAPAFKAFIDPDDPTFVAPADMPAAIDDYCRRTGQPVPENHGEYIRLIFESLALKYRSVLDVLRQVSDHPIEVLHVIGGGSRNQLLNRFTANAIGLPVIAGPAEASALGNIMMQTGCTSLQQLRDVIARSIETVTVNPDADTKAWEDAYGRFRSVTGIG